MRKLLTDKILLTKCFVIQNFCVHAENSQWLFYSLKTGIEWWLVLPG